MAKKTKGEEETPLERLNAKFGLGTIINASDLDQLTNVERIPTGSITLDLACGGGIPRGKCTALLGKESSSKSTLSLHILAEAQKKYPEEPVCYLDIEDSWDSNYAEAIGIDLSNLHIVDSEKLLKHFKIKDRTKVSAEEWLQLSSDLIEMDIYSILVLDSVAAMQPMSEISTGLTEGGRLASIASVMSRAYRALSSSMRVSNTAFLYTNQYRMNPGGYNPLVEPGGEAWKYFQHLKIEISKSLDKDKVTKDVYGLIVGGKITKSKVCQPFKTFEYYVEFGKGIISSYEIIELSIEKEIILKIGNTYSWNDCKLGVGMKQLTDFLEDNPEVLEEIKVQLLLKLNI
jgi:recombination protein RecA